MDTNAIDRITADVLRAKDLPSAVRLLTSDLIAAREAATTSHEQIALAELSARYARFVENWRIRTAVVVVG